MRVWRGADEGVLGLGVVSGRKKRPKGLNAEIRRDAEKSALGERGSAG